MIFTSNDDMITQRGQMVADVGACAAMLHAPLSRPVTLGCDLC